MSKRLVWRRLVLPLALVLGLSTIAFGLLYVRADKDRRATLETEAAKAMLHVIAAVLIGNVVLAIVRDFEERRRGWIAKRDLLRADLTDGLSTLYSQAKGIRRRLRASIRAANDSIETTKYEELLQVINEAQLGLEQYKRAARGGVRVGLLPESVPRHLETMEKYLGKLWTECEHALQSAEASIPLTKLPKMRDFVGSYAKSDFRSSFVHAYYDAAKAVADEIEKELPGSKAS